MHIYQGCYCSCCRCNFHAGPFMHQALCRWSRAPNGRRRASRIQNPDPGSNWTELHWDLSSDHCCNCAKSTFNSPHVFHNEIGFVGCGKCGQQGRVWVRVCSINSALRSTLRFVTVQNAATATENYDCAEKGSKNVAWDG